MVLRGAGLHMRVLFAAVVFSIVIYFGWSNYHVIPRPDAVLSHPDIPNAQDHGSFRDPTNQGADNHKSNQQSSWSKAKDAFSHAGDKVIQTPQGGANGQQETLNVLPLPSEYTPKPWKDEWCVNAYGLEFLDDFRKRTHAYCKEKGSRSEVQCFSNVLAPDFPQSFCVMQNMLLRPIAESKPWKEAEPELLRFGIECELKSWGKDKEGTTIGPEGKHTDLFGMPRLMFDTGIGIMMERYVELWNASNPIPTTYESSLDACAKQPRKKGYNILVKRDGSKGAHPWHSMMEIINWHWNIDILRSTRDPANPSKPYYTDEDIENSQIIILDNEPNGPFWDLWTMLAKKEPVRWTDLDSNTARCLDRVIMPMPGASNPMWSGDWKVRNCRNSPIMDAFIQRGLDHWKIKDRRPANAPITVTFVERHSSRQLLDWTRKVEMVRAHFPDGGKVAIQSVDFAALPTFADQLQVVSETDVLIGAHGAGLSMGMWMPAGGAVVEILPYDFWHKGFRNMAKLMGHRYYSAHSMPLKEGEHWQKVKEIDIEDARWVEITKAAIYGMFHARGVDLDVV